MLLSMIGVSCPMTASAIHMTMILKAIALPRILEGNISEATTNFSGPIENAKQARNDKTAIIRITLFAEESEIKKPVTRRLTAAPEVPIR